MHLLLVGARGSGKTTVGRAMAQAMGGAFVDLDELALARFPETSVTAVWDAHGEGDWRAAELAALDELLTSLAAPGAVPTVVALGGGTPIIPGAAALIDAARSSRVVRTAYLHCSPAVLGQRLSVEPGDRPPLAGRPLVEEAAIMLVRREPAYRAIADVVLEGERPAEYLVRALLSSLNEE
ncbi:MAG: hypothetical protein KDA22_15880 [Phycisphaerales bacterium]|nr:hypothetical protein [Phycisphaerales bacterium]